MPYHAHAGPRRSAPLLALVFAVVNAAACSGPTDPSGLQGVQYYWQEATGLIAPATIAAGFHLGDLLLRPDGSYVRLGAPSPYASDGYYEVGRWRRTGDSLLMVREPGSAVGVALIRGDSLDYGGTRWRRGPLPGAALPAGTWVLRSVNGRTAAGPSGIVQSDDTLGGGRFTSYIQYDSLLLSEGLLARNAFSGTSVWTRDGSPSTAEASSVTSAVYAARDGLVIIQYQTNGQPISTGYSVAGRPDTLAVRGDTLVRTVMWSLGPGTIYRYVRVR